MTWVSGGAVTSPASVRVDTRVPVRTSFDAFTYGICTNRHASRTSTSYPSSRSRRRSGLRSISGCDIEHHPVLRLHGLAWRERTLRLVVVPAAVRDRYRNVRPRLDSRY